MGILVANKSAAALLVVVAALLAATGSAQQQVPSCASKLVPCAPYLNSTSPPDTCCGPMKEAVKNEMPCLCSLFNSPALLKAFNIDLNQVLRLPKACGIKSDTSVCTKSGSGGSASGSPSATTSPPATPLGTTASSAYGAARIGASSLVLFWWSVVA